MPAKDNLSMENDLFFFYIFIIRHYGGVCLMFLRPLDMSGDLLPVLSFSAMLSDAEAFAQLVRYRLSLLRWEWWENLSGCVMEICGNGYMAIKWFYRRFL